MNQVAVYIIFYRQYFTFQGHAILFYPQFYLLRSFTQVLPNTKKTSFTHQHCQQFPCSCPPPTKNYGWLRTCSVHYDSPKYRRLPNEHSADVYSKNITLVPYRPTVATDSESRLAPSILVLRLNMFPDPFCEVQKAPKINSGRSFAPDPTGGAYSAPPDPCLLYTSPSPRDQA